MFNLIFILFSETDISM